MRIVIRANFLAAALGDGFWSQIISSPSLGNFCDPYRVSTPFTFRRRNVQGLPMPVRPGHPGGLHVFASDPYRVSTPFGYFHRKTQKYLRRSFGASSSRTSTRLATFPYRNSTPFGFSIRRCMLWKISNGLEMSAHFNLLARHRSGRQKQAAHMAQAMC